VLVDGNFCAPDPSQKSIFYAVFYVADETGGSEGGLGEVNRESEEGDEWECERRKMVVINIYILIFMSSGNLGIYLVN